MSRKSMVRFTLQPAGLSWEDYMRNGGDDESDYAPAYVDVLEARARRYAGTYRAKPRGLGAWLATLLFVFGLIMIAMSLGWVPIRSLPIDLGQFGGILQANSCLVGVVALGAAGILGKVLSR